MSRCSSGVVPCMACSPNDTFALFDAFGQLPTAQQQAVLDASTPLPKLVAAMTRQFMLMPLARGMGLARATLLRS